VISPRIEAIVPNFTPARDFSRIRELTEWK
jgi:hypothetical protein